MSYNMPDNCSDLDGYIEDKIVSCTVCDKEFYSNEGIATERIDNEYCCSQGCLEEYHKEQEAARKFINRQPIIMIEQLLRQYKS